MSITKTGVVVYIYTFTVTSTDKDGCPGEQEFAITIWPKRIEVTPAAENFGKQPVGTVRKVEQFTVKNDGSGPAKISSVTVGHTAFVITSSDCTGTLGAGQTCGVDVAADPKRPGPAAGALSVDANANGQASTTTVPLSVNGTPNKCHCEDLGFWIKKDSFSYYTESVLFELNWSMTCSGAKTGKCGGTMEFDNSMSISGVLVENTDGKLLHPVTQRLRTLQVLTCEGQCGVHNAGEFSYELALSKADRKNKVVKVSLVAECGKTRHDETFELWFDRGGRVDLLLPHRGAR
jgi:hypothetical protein